MLGAVVGSVVASNIVVVFAFVAFDACFFLVAFVRSFVVVASIVSVAVCSVSSLCSFC